MENGKEKKSKKEKMTTTLARCMHVGIVVNFSLDISISLISWIHGTPTSKDALGPGQDKKDKKDKKEKKDKKQKKDVQDEDLWNITVGSWMFLINHQRSGIMMSYVSFASPWLQESDPGELFAETPQFAPPSPEKQDLSLQLRFDESRKLFFFLVKKSCGGNSWGKEGEEGKEREKG